MSQPLPALDELREASRPLALCLTFEPARNRPLLADLLLFLLEMERAVCLPSESLLVQIRLQWWADGLAGTHQDRAPLLDRLQLWQQERQLAAPDRGGQTVRLADWLALWQQAVLEAERPVDALPDLWGRYFFWLAGVTGHPQEAASADVIGQQLAHILQNGQHRQETASLACSSPFMKACRCLASSPPDRLASPLLPLRLFGRMLVS